MPGFVQIHHAIGEHLGVDAQVLAVHQEGGDGIGNAADAELQGGAIFDQFGDVTADGLFGLGGRGRRAERTSGTWFSTT